MKINAFLSTFFLHLLLVSLPALWAHQQYVSQIPNGNAVGNIQALGHNNPNGGGATNSFGSAYTGGWPLSYCRADSDGDSLSNGFELGDPCCVWKVGQTPQVRYDLSDPGKATGSYAKPATRKCTDFNCSNGINPCTSFGLERYQYNLVIQYGIIVMVMGYVVMQQFYVE